MGKLADALEKAKKEGTLKTPPRAASNIKKTVDKASTPTRFHNPKLIIMSAQDSAEAENIRRVKAQILFPKNGKKPKTILVTSSVPKEGKTFITANLALNIAQGISEYTLAVDCDLRHSRLGNMYGYKNEKGLHEYLNSEMKLNKIIIKTRYDKLSLINAGKNISNPSEILSSVNMEKFIKEVRGRYDDRLIIFDSTPIGIAAETGIIASLVDAIVFVVKSKKTPIEIVKKSIGKLDREKIIGIVFNGYSEHLGTYNSYYKS